MNSQAKSEPTLVGNDIFLDGWLYVAQIVGVTGDPVPRKVVKMCIGHQNEKGQKLVDQVLGPDRWLKEEDCTKLD